MKPFQRIPFFIRLLNWEYWPFSVVYFPIFLYWLFLSVRARSLFFFSAANPGIPTGGFVGESKREIMDMIPGKWKPSDYFLSKNESSADCLAGMRQAGIAFPAIAKPDVGERGMLVRKVHSEQELEEFRAEHPVDFLIQEYVTYKEEVAVLHFRFPGESKGHISSITLKEYLTITGDGNSTVAQLIHAYPRALLQLEALQKSHGDRFDEVLPAGEALQFHTIGNHSKGTKFLNGNHLVTGKLIETFDKINDELEGIYYCRYDIKCASWEALERGEDFRILEINGVKSEPAHIYHPGYSIRKFYRDIFWHWSRILDISKANHALGVPYMTAREVRNRLRALRAYHAQANA